MARRLALAPRGAAGVQRRDAFAALLLQAGRIGLGAKWNALERPTMAQCSGSELGSGDLERRHAISAEMVIHGVIARQREAMRDDGIAAVFGIPRLSRDFFMRMVEGGYSQC